MQLRDYQQAALDGARAQYRQGQRATLIELPTGCHDADQLVLRADGSAVRAADVQVGDRLLGPDGSARTVLDLVRGRAPMVEIVPTKGAPWIVDEDHVLTLVRTPQSSPPRYPSHAGGMLVDVSVREWLGWSATQRHLHKLVRANTLGRFPDAPLPTGSVDPYFLGLVLGVGSNAYATVALTKPDPEVIAACEAEAARWGLTLRTDGTATSPTHHIVGTRGPGGNALLAELRALGVIPCPSERLSVPAAHRTAPLFARAQLLAGLLDANGHLTDDRRTYDYISASPALAADAAFIARSLGLAAYVAPSRKRAQTGAEGTYYRVTISGETTTIPCRVARQIAQPRRQKKDVLRTGFDVRHLGEERAYFGWQLDGDRRYLLEDFTITHNCGKTIVFAEAIRRAAEKGGKALVLAHRTELLEQARAKIRTVAPELRVELEQAGARATEHADVVVASVQTLRGARLERWPADAFALVVVDEAHHATAATYRAILDHFAPARILGVTATPDRADGAKLGEVFPSFAFQLSMQAAIGAGYLVPLRLRTVQVEALRLEHVRSRGGDFVESELVAALEGDEVLLEIAGPLPELAGERQTIVFVAGVANAYRLAELLNTRTGRPGCAVALDGMTDAVARRITLARFERGSFQYLINVGLFTEGFDCPAVSCVAIARPTQSRGLYCQMIGRGTRTLPGTVDACVGPDERVAAIAASSKPDLLVVDFTPTTSQQRLVTPVDVLGVTSEDVRQIAAELLAADPELSVSEAIARAAEDEKIVVRKRLARTYELTVEAWDPFRLVQDDFDFTTALKVDLEGREPEGIREKLLDAGVPKKVVAGLTAGQCVAALRAVQRRAASGMCSLKQAAQLQRFQLNPNVSKSDAAFAMMMMQRAGWTHVPSQLRNDRRFRLPGQADRSVA